MNKPFILEFKSPFFNKDEILKFDGDKHYLVYKQHWANHIKLFFSFLPIKFKYKYYLKEDVTESKI